MTYTRRFKRDKLLYFEEIDTKLIFGKYVSLDQSDCYEVKIILAIYKDNLNEEKDEKAKAK